MYLRTFAKSISWPNLKIEDVAGQIILCKTKQKQPRENVSKRNDLLPGKYNFIDFTLSTQNSEMSFLLNATMQMGEIQLKIMSTVKIIELILFLSKKTELNPTWSETSYWYLNGATGFLLSHLSYISTLVCNEYWLFLSSCRWLSPGGDKRVMVVVNITHAVSSEAWESPLLPVIFAYKTLKYPNLSGLGHGSNTILTTVARATENCGSPPGLSGMK